jgi:putative phosphoserine phosphatase/1-acylglycerol-3-phosphate O-acyltransferase
VVFPQGTIPRGFDFFDPVLAGRYGAARLAIDTGVPVVPIGVWGSERAWPRSSRVPYVMNVADPPRVSVHVGEAFRPGAGDITDVTSELMGRIVELLPPEARHRRVPTEAELSLTLPPGTGPPAG